MNSQIFPNETYYEILGDQTSPSKGGPEKSRKRDKSIFKNMKFYLCGSFTGLPQTDLKTLIELNDGECLESIVESCYIIIDKSVFTPTSKKYKNKIVDSLWLLACLSAYELVDIKPYLYE